MRQTTGFGYAIPKYRQSASANPAYRAASASNAASYNRARQNAYGQAASQSQGADSQFRLAYDSFRSQQGMNAQNERDKFLRFGVGALAGLMR